MGKMNKRRPPERDMLPANLVAFWHSVSEAPWSIFLDTNQDNVQKNLRSTAKVLLRYPPPPHRCNTIEAFLAGIELLSTATSDVGGLVLLRWWMQGDTFEVEKREEREEREASVVLRSVETVQAISDLIAAAKFCGAGFIVRNCLRWLQPTMMKVESHGVSFGTHLGLRLCEGTNLAHTCMDLLEWVSPRAPSIVHVKDLDVLIFETISLMGQSVELMNRAALHPHIRIVQSLARPSLLTKLPSSRLEDLAWAASILFCRRIKLEFDSPAYGDADYVLLEGLTRRLEEAEHRASRGPPMTARHRLALVSKFLIVGRTAVIERLKYSQVMLRSFYQMGSSFDLDLMYSYVSPRRVEERHANFEIPGLKDEWMARDYLQLEYMKQFSTDSDQQLYGWWSSEHVHDQLTEGNQGVELDFDEMGFDEWEQDMASCLHFGPHHVEFSPDRKLPSRDIRPWVKAFIQLPLPTDADGDGWNSHGMVTERRLMRLFVFANVAMWAGCMITKGPPCGTKGPICLPVVQNTRAADGSFQEQYCNSLQSVPSPATALHTAPPSPAAAAAVSRSPDTALRTASPSPAAAMSAVPPSHAAAAVSASSVSSAAPISLGGRYACDSCKAGFEQTQDVKRCSMCKTARYCSKECQRRDWKEGGHKARCKQLTARSR